MNEDQELISALFSEIEEKDKHIARLYRMLLIYLARGTELRHLGDGEHDDNFYIPARQ